MDSINHPYGIMDGLWHCFTITGWWFQHIWKIWVRQLGWWHSQYVYIYIYGRMKYVPNHQPDRHDLIFTTASTASQGRDQGVERHQPRPQRLPHGGGAQIQRQRPAKPKAASSRASAHGLTCAYSMHILCIIYANIIWYCIHSYSLPIYSYIYIYVW